MWAFNCEAQNGKIRMFFAYSMNYVGQYCYYRDNPSEMAWQLIRDRNKVQDSVHILRLLNLKEGAATLRVPLSRVKSLRLGILCWYHMLQGAQMGIYEPGFYLERKIVIAKFPTGFPGFCTYNVVQPLNIFLVLDKLVQCSLRPAC